MLIRAVLACLCLLIATPSWADDVSAADRGAIERVITGQLDAFRRDAEDAAFAFASPNIQSMFHDAPNFMAMVRRAYPPVHRSRSVAFGQLATIDGRLVQRARLVGPDGAAVTALYTMEREPDGTWRIDGCTLLKPDEVAA